jgi:hypothetical protein
LREAEERKEGTHVGRTDLDASDVSLDDVLTVADILCCPEVTFSYQTPLFISRSGEGERGVETNR